MRNLDPASPTARASRRRQRAPVVASAARPRRRRAPRAAGRAAAGLSRGAGHLAAVRAPRRAAAVPDARVLCRLRVLGPGAVHEVRDAGVRARVSGDAPGGVYHAVWVVKEYNITMEQEWGMGMSAEIMHRRRW